MASLDGLDGTFTQRLQALIDAAPATVGVVSGFRTNEQQAALYAKDPSMAAPPGKSNHEHGLAADLSFADAATKAWVHAHAAEYGLFFPMSWEPWHIEPIGLTRGGKDASGQDQPTFDSEAYTQPPQQRLGGYFDILLGKRSVLDEQQNAELSKVGSTVGSTLGQGLTKPRVHAGGIGSALGGTWDFDRTYQLVVDAGGSPDEARLLAAFAGPESGYRPDAVSPTNKNGTTDYGLFQINSVHKQFDPDRLLDAGYNAKAALEILRSQGPQAWSVYNSGKYKAFLKDSA